MNTDNGLLSMACQFPTFFSPQQYKTKKQQEPGSCQFVFLLHVHAMVVSYILSQLAHTPILVWLKPQGENHGICMSYTPVKFIMKCF